MIEKGVHQPCPTANCKEEDRRAFHFGFEKIEDEKNFTPGHKRTVIRMNDPSDITNCLYCGLSMFRTVDGAKERWSKMASRHKELLAYTHILEGDLKKAMGVMTNEKGQHFTFFEYETVELRQHFKVFGLL